MSNDPRELASGQQILHYRLSEKLGEGGMGVVWKATDTTLDRQVAIKVLPAAFAADPERMARFEREARLLASLNHPNIATVFSVHTVEGVRYLTMELVPGEDLAQRIAAGPTPVAEAIEIARQIALALEAAHDSGVVHRDLKPANVRVTPEGRVKVLDFGLAKALEASTSSPALSQSPTFAGTMASGMIIGTAAYMSPEQARGKPVDRRADIWAFGVVCYELLTGRRAFEGETISDTLAAVLRAEPDRALLPADLPRAVRTLVDRCLEKTPHRRLRDIGEAVLVLEDVQAGRLVDSPVAAPAPTPGATRSSRLWLGAGVAAVAAIALLAGTALRPKPAPAPLRKLTLMLEHPGGEVSAPVLSPDGRQIAYVVGRKLWVRDLSQLSSRSLAEGLDEDFRPSWSPDGASIVIGTPGSLNKVAVASGAVTPLCPGDFTGGAGATWLPDGRIVFAKGADHLYAVAGGGGTPTVFLENDSLSLDLHHPHVLPGGAVLYVRHLPQGGPIVLAVAKGNQRKDLLTLPGGLLWEPIYDPRGFILYSRRGEAAGVWALPFSLDRLEATGEPLLVASGASGPTVASDGDLAYRPETQSLESMVVLVDAKGAVVDTLAPPRAGVWSMAISPDERMLVMETREGGEGDLWLYDLERGSQTRFAFGAGRQMEPAWSPDSRLVAYRELGQNTIFIKPADGTIAPRPLARGVFPTFTSDGRRLLFGKGRFGTEDIWSVAVDAPEDTVEVVATPAAEFIPAMAPQGTHMLYASDESGRSEVYLRQYPTGPGRWQVSTNGGGAPQWSPDGAHAYYRNGEDIFEVPVTLAPTVRLGAPVLRFRMGTLRMQTWGRYNFLPSSRRERFVMLKPLEGSTPATADVVLVENWQAEFAKK